MSFTHERAIGHEDSRISGTRTGQQFQVDEKLLKFTLALILTLWAFTSCSSTRVVEAVPETEASSPHDL